MYSADTKTVGWVFILPGDPDSVSGDFGQNSLYKMLGYFSLIGLLRLHSLLGDYYQALKVLENIDFNKKVWGLGIIPCLGRNLLTCLLS